MKLLDWVKENKLTAFLLFVVGFLVFKSSFSGLGSKRSYISNVSRESYDYDDEALPMAGGGEMASLQAPMAKGMVPPSAPESAPTLDKEERMVVEESNVSLLVEGVSQKLDQIIKHTEGKGGYMVSSSLKQPEEAPFATLVLRVPQKELRPTLEYLRDLSIRVTSENLSGRDVTDQYFDLEARLETLEKTRIKFEEILEKAVKVDDILRVQREIVSLQSQIDNLKGRQEYLKKTSESAKLTIYLSSDEWALPYAPSKPFRVKVIFKQAVRSLILALRGLAKSAIWLGVYAVIWLPALIIFLVVKRKLGKK